MALLKRGDFFEGGTTIEKSASAGDFSGMSRKRIVEEKINAKKQFIVGNADSGKKIYGISVDTSKFPFKLTYTKTLGTDAEGVYPITKLFKDKDFGGGGSGSGGGQKETELTEFSKAAIALERKSHE